MNQGRFFCALAAALLLCFVSSVAFAAETDEYLRLHIIANSDEAEDQAVKLIVRDAVREAAREALSGCNSSRAAYRTLAGQAESLCVLATRAAREAGFSGDVSLEMGFYAFPARNYGETVVPAGDYHALRVILGAGKGKNWWCVLYPSLCLPEDADTPTIADAPRRAFYSDIWRALWAWFGGDAR